MKVKSLFLLWFLQSVLELNLLHNYDVIKRLVTRDMLVKRNTWSGSFCVAKVYSLPPPVRSSGQPGYSAEKPFTGKMVSINFTRIPLPFLSLCFLLEGPNVQVIPGSIRALIYYFLFQGSTQSSVILIEAAAASAIDLTSVRRKEPS